jgi:malate dehydrogenase (oxaloacetate-decarboxylating)
LLNYIDVNDVTMCDSKGIIYQGRTDLNVYKQELAEITNIHNRKGSLADAVADADIFIGVSVAYVLTPDMVSTMADKPIIFALANPEPEIKPELAKKAGVEVMATGRSDYPNQVNNVLAFPGIFRGALDAGADEINIEMKLAAARAISGIIADEVKYDYIIPKPFNPRVMPAVAAAVAESAVATEYADPGIDIGKIKKNAEKIASRNK